MGEEHSWKRIPDPVLHKQEICQRKQNKDDQQEQNDKLHNSEAEKEKDILCTYPYRQEGFWKDILLRMEQCKKS